MTLCYLDANATTFMPEVVLKSLIKWSNKGNGSAHYCVEFRSMLEKFREKILNDNKLTDFSIIFTSGASESNSHIIVSSVRSFMNKTGHLPHVIISNIEHKSIKLCCEDLKNDGLCSYTEVCVRTDPEFYGSIHYLDVQKAIRPNTCLISIMAANNETGVINDIPLIASIAHKHKIPFHSDYVQYFGKYGIYNGVDACSISFHKLSGPPGLGCLIIRNNFIKGYDLKALISGTQNYGLRGGTENIPAIGASFAAYQYNLLKRKDKNEYLISIKAFLKALINKYYPCYNILEYDKEKNTKNKIFWIENQNNKRNLPNTVLLAVYKDDICNVKMKNELEKFNILISIGSACNTSSDKASDVIYALDIPKELKSGILRISFYDDITKDNIIYFVSHFIGILNSKLISKK